MARQIALLRGINLGKHRRIAMGDLRELLTELGYEDVRTHLQSGNVVLASDRSNEALARELEREIAAQLGVGPLVVVRTRDELAAVVARDPFGDEAPDPKRYLVTFLSARPDPAVVRETERRDFGPERVHFSGREVYSWHPGGLQRSKLAAALTDKKLGVVATNRNWSTVTKLLALADQ